MDKVKLEKLKKSLDNKFLNDDMKDKIRKEIESMEKESVKEVKKPVAKAKKVVAKAEPKAKVEVKAEAPKKTTKAKKTISGESKKTISIINRRKEYKKTLTKSPDTKYDIKKDAVRKALPMGKRTSKMGNVYYENRFNHADLGGTKGAYLKDGGSISDKSTYIGKREIDSVKTVYGQTIKGNRLFDGNYVKGKVKKPTMSRTQFEEETYDYESGGSLNRRTRNAKALKIANFEDISFINLVKLLPTKTNQHDYKSDKVYGIVVIDEIHNIKVLEFKTLMEAEKRFNDLVEEKSSKTKLLDLITLKNNYLFGGRLKSALMRDRKNVNKSETWERSYSKPKAHRSGYLGKRDFARGGAVNFDTNSPKIYVADLEAYNNGKLVGKWLDLSDYSDADELEEAIQDLLTEWGAEEYAIHDTENIPSSMYSEYMGARDFEELYTMIDLANDKDLPLEVVQEIVSQFDESAVDEFYGKYDSAEDFAESLVDDLGIESFSNFESYLYVTDTDARLLAQEMADNYVDDIIAEDDGERIIGEAELDLDEYQEADEDRREAMIEEAREIVYDAYYDEWYNGLKSDPYSFLVEEQGMYDAESFANSNFAVIDYEKIVRDLEDDYTFIHDDNEVYVFNIR